MLRNKLLKEYSQKELEELFIELCESLDEKASEIYNLEVQLSKEMRQKRLAEDLICDNEKEETAYAGKDIPELNDKNKKEIRKLLNEIDELDLKLRREEVKKNEEMRELNYIRSFFVFPNKKYHVDDVMRHSPIQQRKDLIEYFETIFANSNDWKTKNKCMACLNILNMDFDDAINFMKTEENKDHVIFKTHELRDQIKAEDEKIEELNKMIEEKKARKKMVKKRVNAAEDKINELEEAERDKHLELTALQNKKEKKEKEASVLKENLDIISKLYKEIDEIQSLIRKRKLEMAVELGYEYNGKNFVFLNDNCDNEINKLHLKKLRALVAKNEESLKEKKEELERLKKDYSDTEKAFEVLKEEYRAMRDKYFEIRSKIGLDPFNETPFLVFLDQLNRLNWTTDDVESSLDKIEAAKEKIEKVDLKLNKRREKRKKLQEQVSKLEDMQKERLDRYKNKVIIHGDEEIVLYEGQNAFMLGFSDISFKGIKKESVTFVITFLGQTIEMPLINPLKNKYDDVKVLIPCEKDNLITKIVTENIRISLQNQKGEEIANGSVNLTPLVSCDKFVTAIQLFTENKKCISAACLKASLIEPICNE